jgi:hypothetical protein
MNPAKQFWALLKFQTTMNPSTWFLPLVFVIPLLLPLIDGPTSKSYHPGFVSLFMNQNLFFIGFIGAMVLAPEMLLFGATNVISSYYGSEFLLTRAIDRSVLYRAKAALLFILVLIGPCIMVIHSLGHPDLVVNEYSKPVQVACLATVPGSALLPAEDKGGKPSLLAIPRGNLLVAEWQFFLFMITALALQLLILILYPFKHAKWIFWTIFFGLIFAPLFYTIHEITQETPSFNERSFFFFTRHQVLFWCVTGVIFVATQLWCERRFARLELQAN